MFFSVLVIFFVILPLIIYTIGKRNENYWKRRGIVFHGKNKITGPFWEVFTSGEPFYLHLQNIYNQYPDQAAVGIGGCLTPSLYVRDPKNVQAILSSDFNSFYHRGFEVNENDKLANNILFLNGSKWKLMRQSMTPLFTSLKLKNMFYIMDKSAQDFVQYIKESPEIRKGNTFQTLSTFCSAAIGASVFGLTTESIFDSPFLKIAQKIFEPTLKSNLRFAISNLSQTLFHLFKIQFFKEFEDFFIDAIKRVVRQRKEENIKKHDFADICVALQKNGMLKDPETGLELEPTYELLAAQAFFFFNAGVEPVAAAMFSALIEIGKNPEIQKKVHEEIDRTFDKNNGKLNFDIIAEMVYLDMVINEAMRMYPPIGFLSRQCVEDTVLPSGNIPVEKGTKIFVPIFEFHHDPKYFPNPEEFNPERFSRENKKKMSDITYLPFGKGNRICIGMRYAHMQTKTGLVHLLRNFNVKTNIGKGGIKYVKHQFQMRLTNVDVEFLNR